MGICVGIDMGQAFSTVAIMDAQKGRPVTIPNTLGETSTPSVIQFTEDDEIIVGTPAKEALEKDEPGCAAFFMRDLSRIYRSFNGKDHTTAELPAFLLRALKEEAETVTGQTIKAAAVTVPAYFVSENKLAMLQVAQEAGLDVFWLIPEPIAAVMDYAIDHWGKNN